MKHLRASILLSVTSISMLTLLPGAMGFDSFAQRSDAQQRINKLGLIDDGQLAATDLEVGADLRWTFPRLKAAQLKVGDSLLFNLPGARAIEIPLVSRSAITAGSLAMTFADHDSGNSAEIVIHKSLVRGTVRVVVNDASGAAVRFESWTLATSKDGEQYSISATPQECSGCEQLSQPGPVDGDGDGDGAEGGVAGDCADSGQVIDLLIAVTPSFVDDNFASFDEFELAALLDVNSANAALANSRVYARYRVVAFSLLTSDGSGNLVTDLNQLTSVNDGVWDEIHVVRNAKLADVVSLYSDSSPGGVAFLGVGNQATAFNVVGGFGGTLLAHELGHTMGCCHAYNDGFGCTTGGYYPYSNGWRFFAGAVQYRTVMAYSPGTQIPYYSNPDVYYQSKRTGATGVDPATSANNARTQNLTAYTVANYRCGSSPESDCDGDGIGDDSAIEDGIAFDCNLTGLPDSCDIAIGISLDLKLDGVPDECPLLDFEVFPQPIATLDTFGSAVAMTTSANGGSIFTLVGAPGDDDLVSNGGSVSLFTTTGGITTGSALLPAVGNVNAFFGRGVAVFGRPASTSTPIYPARNLAIVGAYRYNETLGATTYVSKGAICLFAQNSNGTWSQRWTGATNPGGYIRPGVTGSNGATDYALFGYSVAIGRHPIETSEHIVAGAPGRANGAGVVYLYSNSNSDVPIGRGTRLLPSPIAGDNFGAAVALDNFVPVTGGSKVVIVAGAPGRSASKGIAVIYERNPLSNSLGAFPTSGTALNPVGAGTSLLPGDLYGSSVAIYDNLIVIGAPGTHEGRGRVHFWERTAPTNGVWVYKGFYEPADALIGDAFGSSVAIAPSVDGTARIITVGAAKADIVVNASQIRIDAGMVTLLRRVNGATGATFVEKRTANDPATGDAFGYSAASVRGLSVGGAPFNDEAGLNAGKARFMLTP